MEDPCSSARIQEYWSGPRCYFGEAHLEFSGLGRIVCESNPKSGLVSGRGGPLVIPGGHFLAWTSFKGLHLRAFPGFEAVCIPYGPGVSTR